jgi:calcineurin-like phosphoesterase family protein
MLIRFCSDPHVGNHKLFGGQEVAPGVNARCNRILAALDCATMQGERTVDQLVILGDLFDTDKPTPQLVAATLRALLRDLPEEEKVPALQLLLGNHDMTSARKGDNAFASMEFARETFVHDEPGYVRFDNGVVLLMLPFRPQPTKEWFYEALGDVAVQSVIPSQLGKISRDTRILCFHAGVRDVQTPFYLKESADAVDIDPLFVAMERADIQFAVCGNWHNHRTWQRKMQDGRLMSVVQCGALAPSGFDNPGWEYGRVFDFDVDFRRSVGGKQRQATINKIHGPRFIVVNSGGGVSFNSAERGADEDLFFKIKMREGETQEEAREWFRKYVGLERFGGVIYEPFEQDTRAQDEEAAEAARVSETLDEALRGYIGEMPLPDNVERGEVETQALGYLNRGS